MTVGLRSGIEGDRRTPGPLRRLSLPLAFWLVPFIVLATLNSGGYRYGASDQAFYQPAVLKQLDPELFPRDTVVLAAQTRLTAAEEVVALVVRLTGGSVPRVFAGLYLLALSLFAWGAWGIGRLLYRDRWTAVAFLAALTLRHAIARSGTNTLEGYFQPRLLAYALGALAIALFLRGRTIGMAALLATAAAVHPTTAVWFALWLAVATWIVDVRARRWLAGGAAAATSVAIWALVTGPLAGRLIPLDAAWRATLVSKDYLFPLEWPLYAWVLNLGYLPVIAWLHRKRRAARLADERERALVLGSGVLIVIFGGALIGQAANIALAVQLQPARIFWMYDFLAVLHLVWWAAEGRAPGGVHSGQSRTATAAALIAAFSMGRAAYVLYEAKRPPLQLEVADDDWGRVMAFARTTPKNTGWLAHSRHAELYGTSVRVAGERDVLVEAVKDTAIGIYDRGVALRSEERIQAVPDFEGLTAEEARRLARRYRLDYLVTEQSIALPLAFESGRLRVYRLE